MPEKKELHFFNREENFRLLESTTAGTTRILIWR